MAANYQESDNYRRRKLKNHLMLGLMGLTAIIAVFPLFAVLLYVIIQGIGSINLGFFTQLPAAPNQSGGGMGNAIVGTLELLAIASVFAIPIGILVGVYLAEYGDESHAGKLVRFVSDVLTGVPTIVTGLFIYGLVVLQMGHYSVFAGGISLAIIMIPILARTTEEVIRLVPGSVREASLGLGVPQWKTIMRIVLPAASGGIITGVMLGISRIAGETAPLLFTAGVNNYWSINPNQTIASLPVQIYNFSTGPYDNWHQQAWGGALVLITIVLIFNLGARWVTRSRSIKRR